MTIYVVDSSAWIDAWRRYPPDPFQKIWNRLGEMVAAGTLRVPEEVLLELKTGTDNLVDQLTAWPGLAYPLDAALQASVRTVVGRFPLQDPDSERSRADPFVVGLAVTLHQPPDAPAVVVSNERRMRGASTRPRIPDACDGFGIRCVQWLDFLREQRWDL